MKNSITRAVSTAPGKLGRGTYQGFSKLPSQIGVYRCLVRPVLKKRDPNHSDYYGQLTLTGSKAHVHVWLHEDGSLGLRLEKIVERPTAATGGAGE